MDCGWFVYFFCESSMKLNRRLFGCLLLGRRPVIGRRFFGLSSTPLSSQLNASVPVFSGPRGGESLKVVAIDRKGASR